MIRGNSLYICLFVIIALVGATVADDFNFCVIGDFGGMTAPPQYTQVQLKVAAAMGGVCQNINSHFVVSVGDNIYDEGAVNEFDPRFKVSFEDIYTAPSLQTPWYLVPGNRDYYSGNVSAEIEYSKHSTRWTMPGLYFEKTFNDTNGQPLLQLLLVDTFDLTDKSKGPYYPAANPAKALEVQTFLRTRLSINPNPYIWRIVVSHYPIWSSGSHGPNNTDLITNLWPILRDYQVDAYFAGHDHSLQHLQKPWTLLSGNKGPRDDFNFYAFGPGAEAEDNELGYTMDPSPVRFHYPNPRTALKGGFGTVRLNHTHMTVSFYNEDGLHLYDSVLPAIRQPPAAPSSNPAASSVAPTSSSAATGAPAGSAASAASGAPAGSDVPPAGSSVTPQAPSSMVSPGQSDGSSLSLGLFIVSLALIFCQL